MAGQVPLPYSSSSTVPLQSSRSPQVSAERPLQSQPSPAHTGEVHEMGGMNRHFFLSKPITDPWEMSLAGEWARQGTEKHPWKGFLGPAERLCQHLGQLLQAAGYSFTCYHRPVLTAYTFNSGLDKTCRSERNAMQQWVFTEYLLSTYCFPSRLHTFKPGPSPLSTVPLIAWLFFPSEWRQTCSNCKAKIKVITCQSEPLSSKKTAFIF